ncbi:MAG: pirin family protein [Verrucomicrobiales bacterium]|nr:pirin family protein [Verrucomicrobiales bacterium]
MKKRKNIIHSPGMHWVGNGFPVRSVFSYDQMGRELDPFLLLDYAEPYRFEPGREKRGVGSHPHRGFETVTFAFQGEVEHRDSSGGGGVIKPGDVQWMTAGAGLLHEEFHSEDFTKNGGLFEMVQLWVNLPAANKNAPPRYQNLSAEKIPVVALPEQAGQLRVVAGTFDDTQGPANTFTDINLWDIHQNKETTTTLPAPDGHTTALLVMKGKISTDGDSTGGGSLVIFDRNGSNIEINAESDSHYLLLGGKPIGEPIVGQGPFVMNNKQEIMEAYRDFQIGKMGSLE